MSEKCIMNIAYGKPDPFLNGKKDWIAVGHLIISQNDDEGDEIMSIKLNEIPLDASFNEIFSVFPSDKNKHYSDNKKLQQLKNDIALAI